MAKHNEEFEERLDGLSNIDIRHTVCGVWWCLPSAVN